MFLAVSDVSDITSKVDEAFYWIGGICLFLLVGITVAMVGFIIKYHRTRNPKATQIEGNTPLEITWIVIPTIIVIFMFFKGYEGFKMMRTVPDNARTVEVVAQQWFWTFNYPETGISSSELYAPVNQPIRLELITPEEDVVHSFYLPAFRVKEDCVPGKINYMWFESKKVGDFNIFCAEYCGKDHSAMISKLHVLTQEDYDAWVDRMLADKNKPIVMEAALNPRSQDILDRDADMLYKTYCVSCHGKNGLGGLVEGARDFSSLEEWTNGPKLTDIYRTLETGIKGTQMRSFSNLNEWDRFALVHKVASFYKGTARPENTPEEIAQLKADFRLGEVREVKERISVEDAMKAIATEAEEGK